MNTKEVAKIMNSSVEDLRKEKQGSIMSSSDCIDRWFVIAKFKS